MEHDLSTEQQELVALGAGIGAGCQPCVTHHLKAGAKAGLEGERLLAAVMSAERVVAEAAVGMADHAREALGPGVAEPALLPRLEEALASLGAALAANDVRNVERHVRLAVELGASRSQLQRAIETAHSVQENAARIHLREAERLLDEVAPAVASDAETRSGSGCGCGSDEAAPPEPEERAAATSRHSAGCDSMAARFGSATGSGAMAGCRDMFEQFLGAVAPAETTRAPAATTAAGPCKKED